MILSHFVRHFSSAENVEMKMLYALAGIVTAICDNTVSVCKTFRLRYLRYSLENLCNASTVLLDATDERTHPLADVKKERFTIIRIIVNLSVQLG